MFSMSPNSDNVALHPPSKLKRRRRELSSTADIGQLVIEDELFSKVPKRDRWGSAERRLTKTVR